MALKFSLLLLAVVVVAAAVVLVESTPVEDLNVIPHDPSFYQTDPVNRYPPVEHPAHTPGYHPPAHQDDGGLGGIVRSALAIPIGILKSLQESLHRLVSPKIPEH